MDREDARTVSLNLVTVSGRDLRMTHQLRPENSTEFDREIARARLAPVPAP